MRKLISLKYVSLLILLLLSYAGFTQNNRKYKKETIYFLNSIRTNERIFGQDTIKVLHYLSNNGLYKYLIIPNSEDWSKGNLNMDERNIFFKLTLDTTKLKLEENSISKVILVPLSKEQNYLQFAKPIFYKKYTLCIFCKGGFSDGGSQETFLFKKEKNKWVLIRKLGGVLNY
jgi:hypothetical protein